MFKSQAQRTLSVLSIVKIQRHLTRGPCWRRLPGWVPRGGQPMCLILFDHRPATLRLDLAGHVGHAQVCCGGLPGGGQIGVGPLLMVGLSVGVGVHTRPPLPAKCQGVANRHS